MRYSKYADKALFFVAEENPARKDTDRHAAYAAIKRMGDKGLAFETYREAGHSIHDLDLGVERRWIKVKGSDKPASAAEPKKPAAKKTAAVTLPKVGNPVATGEFTAAELSAAEVKHPKLTRNEVVALLRKEKAAKVHNHKKVA